MKKPRQTMQPADDERGMIPDIIVFDDDRETGLLDAQGNPIVRRRLPIGFDLSKPKRMK